MKKNILISVISMLIGGLIFGSVAFASGINVQFLPLKYFINGEQKFPPSDQQGFVYNGRTYIPLRFMAEALGQNVDWNGNTNTIYVTGANSTDSNISGSYESQFLTDLVTPFNNSDVEINKSFALGDDEYTKDIIVGQYDNSKTVSFDLKGEYKHLKFKVGTLPAIHNTDGDPFTIYGDNNVLKEVKLRSENLPQEVDLDITGVKELRFEGTYNWFVLNPEISK